jgi:hypothetical protein
MPMSTRTKFVLSVAAVYSICCLVLGTKANELFQIGFDTGQWPTGNDAIVLKAYKYLALPIPGLLFATHPANRFQIMWWSVTAIDGLIWGYAFYFLTRLPMILRARFRKPSAQGS